jgi:hypothetical protein
MRIRRYHQSNKRVRAAAVDRSATAAVLLAATLVLAGGALRAVNLDQPLLNFHPTRQYRAALLARACYYDAAPNVSEAARRVARANRALQPAGEPPLMEWLACESYAISGCENLSLPHAFAALSWVLGTFAVYGIGRRVATATAAIVGVAIYLFIPYGVIASRAFQPDALMTSCALWAMLAVFRYHEHPGRGRFLMAAAGLATAAIVKPMSVFLTVPVAIALAARMRVSGKMRWQSWTLLAVGLAPAAALYGYSAIFGTLARDQMRLRFVPSLLPTEFFWSGLLTQVRRVFGLPLFAATIAGTVVARGGAPRWLLLALWTGYAAFAIAFTYHMPTHDYYHLPFVTLAALASTALIDRVRVPAIHLAIALAFAAWGTWTVWPRLTDDSLRSRVGQYEEIGALADHTTHAVFLDLEYGYPLMYHGEVSGDSWPSRDDLRAEAMGGAPPIDATSRFARDYNYGATHFIVTDLASLAAQPDLQQLLASRATVVRQTPQYQVYRFK